MMAAPPTPELAITTSATTSGVPATLTTDSARTKRRSTFPKRLTDSE